MLRKGARWVCNWTCAAWSPAVVSSWPKVLRVVICGHLAGLAFLENTSQVLFLFQLVFYQLQGHLVDYF